LIDGEGYVVLNETEIRPPQQPGDILAPSSMEIVNTGYLVARLHQAFAKEAADEPCTAGNKYTLTV
jgi:hypothetical protein